MGMSLPGSRPTSGATTMSDTTRPPGWWALGLMRILIGVLWWTQLLWKKPPDFGSPGGCPADLIDAHTGRPIAGLHGLCDWMHREALHPITPTFFGHTFTVDTYANFVRDAVIPHFTLFGWLTVGTETFITVSLVLGLFTRLGGLVGALWALNLTVGLWSVPNEWYWTYLMLAALNLIFFATRAGRYFGVDSLLTHPDSPIGSLARLLG